MRVHRTSALPRLRPLKLLLIPLLLISGGSLVSGNSFTVTAGNLIVQLGTYYPTLKQCFYQRTFAGTVSPDTISFTNPTGNAINFISVETDQAVDHGGVSATIISGTPGINAAITLQLTTTPRTALFKNNIDVKMYCAQPFDGTAPIG